MEIFGILVVYNPTLTELEESVRRLEKECSLIIVCNNSDNGLIIPDMIGHKILNFENNLGIAKAQSVAMKWAFDNGADFVVQMDQDSVLEEGTVKSLVSNYFSLLKKGINVGVIGPRHFDKVSLEVDEGRLIKGNLIDGTQCEEIHATISSASLIPKEAYLVAGSMDDGLFIDSVDWEYCWRLKKLGFVTIRVNNLLLGHRVGDGKKKIIGSIDARVPSPIRHYYHTRNLFLLTPRCYVPIYWKLSNYVKLIMKLVIYPFVFDDGIVRLKYMTSGIKDGLLGKYGRIDKASRGNK